MTVSKKIVVYLASPRGFCAGVERAIETVKLSLSKYGKPVYVLHEIVHNKHVIDELKELGAVFVEHLADVPSGEVCVFSAHGVSLAVESYARELGLRTIDATCPLVTSVHRMVEKYHQQGIEVLIIGHHNHPEVEGTAGRVEGGVLIVATECEAEKLLIKNPEKLGYVTQTTLCKRDIEGIFAILKKRFPCIQGPRSNICFATQNRQDAVRLLAEKSELIFVVGSKNSSNSNRLKEVARSCDVKAYLIDDYNDIDEKWLAGVCKIGITAGASAPERLVDGVIDWLKTKKEVSIEQMDGAEENIHFQAAVISAD
ncbi:MAG: 4-hydroxy-3-methylbut-2-enyl diphosphate reductase [Desulforhopalus sp.]|jgi:4-hydroxy-3-methylbut-2-enyl diphosphate reductase